MALTGHYAQNQFNECNTDFHQQCSSNAPLWDNQDVAAIRFAFPLRFRLGRAADGTRVGFFEAA